MMIFLMILTLIIIAGLIWLASQPSDFDVVRSRIINADATTLYNEVKNLRGWKDWSPWLMHEPDAPLSYADDVQIEGGWYSWNGERVGAGKLTHIRFIENEAINQKIEFTAPMKSTSRVYWRFEPVEGGTDVSWGMHGNMPFFFRWMTRMMDQWVGKDYEIGLAKLAMQVGDNDQAFDFSFDGIIDNEAQTYVATPYEGSIEKMSEAMEKEFPALINLLKEQDAEIAGAPLAIYHKFNPKKDYVRCEIAVPVAAVPEGFTLKTLPAGRYFKTTVKGDYSVLEMAWHSAFSHIRMAKHKWRKSAPMIERYETDPDETSGLEVVTVIEIPV